MIVVVVSPAESAAVIASFPLLAVVGKTSTDPAVPLAPASTFVALQVGAFRVVIVPVVIVAISPDAPRTTALLDAAVPAETPSR